jgi:nitroimidazol reductase NimA-like FMN-containing flavoprotein (pyridoxamine 5'-phosphate oxidase superfamily)
MATMSESEQNKLLESILKSQYLGVLSSIEYNRPYSNLIAFAETGDFKSILFATERNTRKYSNIKTNSNVSLLIDSRSNQSTDFSTALALTAIGSAVEVEADDRKKMLSIFIDKQPHLVQFVNSKTTALIVINVSDYIIAGFNSPPMHISMV